LELAAVAQTLVQLPAASVRASKRLTARAFDLAFDEFRREMQAEFKVCLDSDEHTRAMDMIRTRRLSARPSGAGALRRHPDGKSKKSVTRPAPPPRWRPEL